METISIEHREHCIRVWRPRKGVRPGWSRPQIWCTS